MIMIKMEEYLAKDEFEICLRLKKILESKKNSFSDISRLMTLYKQFLEDFQARMKEKVRLYLIKTLSLILDKQKEQVSLLKDNFSKKNNAYESSMINEISLLKKVQNICSNCNINEFFEETLSNQMKRNLSYMLSKIETSSDFLKLKIVEIFSFQLLIKSISEQILFSLEGLTSNNYPQFQQFTTSYIVS